MGTAFKLDDLFPYDAVGYLIRSSQKCCKNSLHFVFLYANWMLLFSLQDPHLRNMEGCFALQKKIVEAAKKLAYENELCKTVKKKRRRNLLDATKKLQEIENEINCYRVKIGKEPTQRASVIIAGTYLV